MTVKTSKLRDAIVFALVAGATGVAGTGVAFAQDTTQEQQPPAEQQQSAAQQPTAQQEAQQLDTIVVTGTRIQSQSITASSPVVEINQEQFQMAGATRVEDLVNQYPQMAPVFDNFINNGAQGYSTANLRGLGAGRTLTLINGQRLAPGNGVFADLSQVPAALVKRVDILTGGASAVYGSDAVAGVVNFILDTEFEGFSVNVGYSAYQHNNDNGYMQGLQDEAGFPYETGNSGFDGKSRNIDLVWGSQFADGAGHASAWLTWRRNDPLFMAQRDYASCALSSSGLSCGGSANAAKPNFLLFDNVTGDALTEDGFAHLNDDGSWGTSIGELYNYAPINYYQRPEDKINFGASLKYEVNEHFRPYVEMMYTNRSNSVQIAESGTFFADAVTGDCTNPLFGSMCADLGIDPATDIVAYVGKRNVEGGPRHTDIRDSIYRVVAGSEGSLGDAWSYNVAGLFARTNAKNTGTNDFLSDRIVDGLLGCPPDSFTGCIPYNVWVPGGVTAEAALALAGTSMVSVDTALTSLNGYVTGDLGFGIPWAGGDPISLVVGGEWRSEEYTTNFDSNSQSGNFAGAGGPALPVSGQTEVTEVFMEAAVPVLKDVGIIDSFNLDLGYRLSDYDRSGQANTYKIGFNSEIGEFRVRGGYNRAIRAPNIVNLFTQRQIALFGGEDPCAGATPDFTLAQCQNTGVTAAQYGNILSSPADQYNQQIGGDPTLFPETADTYTLGFAATPISGLELSVDYYDIQIVDRIVAIGGQTILNTCGTTGDPGLCSLIHRAPGRGDLWIGNDLATSGYVTNFIDNFGELHTRGLDLTASYNWDMLGGYWNASMVGVYVLEFEIAPLPGVNDDATYDCAGLISTSCQNPEWRHVASLRYARDWFSVNLRWRYFGELDYIETDGSPGAVLDPDTGEINGDNLLYANGNKVDAFNYFDLSGTFQIGDNIDWTVGVNNIADKEPPLVGGTLVANANSLAGYDQAGRFFFTSVTMKF